MDPEYTVLGRVARRIWAVAMRDRCGAHERSQKLQYHVQTRGRSLHAQEIQFDDIRTTLQALIAVYDNCNQGAFIIDERTELVETAVLAEFEKIAERGGC